jgi:hypothetical protein
MDERTVDTLSQKLTVPLQLQLDSVSDGLKEEYRNLLGSLRDDLYSLKMETAGFPWHFGPKVGERSANPFQRSPGREYQQHHPRHQPGRHHASKSSCQLDYLRHLVLTNFLLKIYYFLFNF